MYDDIKKELDVIARNNGLNYFAMWGIEGGNGWIWSKQEEDKEFKIQIFTTGSFDTYKKIKEEIASLFSRFECSLADEEKIEQKFGYRRNLVFVDKNKYNTRNTKEEIETEPVSRAFIIGKSTLNGPDKILGAYNDNEILDDNEQSKSIFNKSNRLEILNWINEILLVRDPHPINDVLRFLGSNLVDKFDVQWSVGNNKKDAVNLYAHNDDRIAFGYLKIVNNELNIGRPRGVGRHSRVKMHRCVKQLIEYKLLDMNNVGRVTEILLKAIEIPNDTIDGLNDLDEEEQNFRVCNLDSDNPDGFDCLNITKDVEAIANLIAMRDLSTPLAIGLFGNWGSGKSFFMRKIYEKVNEIKENIKNIGLKEKNNTNTPLNNKELKFKELFYKNIVQINFNAWHYVDANLWASLVSNIFENIIERNGVDEEERKIIEPIKKSIFDKLESLQEIKIEFTAQKEKLEQKYKVQQKQLSELEELSKKNYNEIWLGIIEKIVQDEKVFKMIDEKTPNIGKVKNDVTRLVQSKTDFDEIAKDLSEYHNKVKLIWNYLNTTNKCVIIASLTILLAIWFGVPVLVNNLNIMFKSFYEVTSKILVLVTPFIAWMKSDSVNSAKEKAKELIDYFVKLSQRQKIELYDQESKLRKTKSKIDEIKFSCDSIQREITNVTNELENIKKGKYLKHFIEKRLDSDDYKKHLGIINMIRKDFAFLNTRLREKDLPEEYRVDRIILYIDDLDRCPPENVVDVLQAIHLILSYEIFTVIVAVDVRWVSKCLYYKYKSLFRNNANYIGASTYDYLEKIFQIPIRLQTVSEMDSIHYIDTLLKRNTKNDKTVAENTNRNENIINSEIQIKEEAKLEDNLDETIKMNPSFEDLIITDDDLIEIKKYVTILGDTPRTIKRFVNIYKLIKASYVIKFSYVYFNQQRSSILFLLSIVVGLPYISSKVFTEIRTSNENGNDIIGINSLLIKFKSEFQKDTIQAIEFGKLKKFLDALGNGGPKVRDFENLLSEVGKYSFHIED